MTVKDLETLFEYGYRANRKLLEAQSPLTAEQFTQPVAGSCGSIRNTMVHMLSAEWGWLDRCGGTSRGPALEASDYPTVASVFDRWDRVEGYVREFLSTLRDEDLDRRVEFALGGGPRQVMSLGALMHHAANHGVHHRGQVALLLRSLGFSPGNFDLLLYPQIRRPWQAETNRYGDGGAGGTRRSGSMHPPSPRLRRDRSPRPLERDSGEIRQLQTPTRRGETWWKTGSAGLPAVKAY